MASSEQDATTQKVTANSRMTQHGSARRIPKLSINFEGVKQHFPCTTNKLTAAVKWSVSCMNRPLCDVYTERVPPSAPVVARLRTCGSKLQCHGCRYNSNSNNVQCPPPRGLRAALWLMMCLIGIIKQNKCQLLYQCAVPDSDSDSVWPMKFLGIMPELQSYWIVRQKDGQTYNELRNKSYIWSRNWVLKREINAKSTCRTA